MIQKLGYFSEEPDDCATGEKYGGRYFTLVDQPRVYSEAKFICEELGGHLASIHSQKENNFVKDLIADNGWVGK